MAAGYSAGLAVIEMVAVGERVSERAVSGSYWAHSCDTRLCGCGSFAQSSAPLREPLITRRLWWTLRWMDVG